MIPDRIGRPLRNLRLSVTDRCNLRCSYCMPEADYAWLPREDILSFEEIETLAGVFLALGVDKIRLTGGEPLLRRDLPALVSRLAALPGVRDLAMTTNGVLLAGQARALAEAGLHRLTVSLDTLHPDRFRALTRFDELERVQEALAAVAPLFPARLKIDSVILRGVNDDEPSALLDYARAIGAEIRFIEYMDVGGATRWTMDDVVTGAEILAAIAANHGDVEAIEEESSAPARRYRLRDGTVFGVIASTTAPFCGRCDRSRLTADGIWYLCLYAREGVDLRRALRRGDPPAVLAELIARTWRGRTDTGAEDRLAARHRTPLIPVDTLRRDPHLEMHTRGG